MRPAASPRVRQIIGESSLHDHSSGSSAWHARCHCSLVSHSGASRCLGGIAWIVPTDAESSIGFIATKFEKGITMHDPVRPHVLRRPYTLVAECLRISRRLATTAFRRPKLAPHGVRRAAKPSLSFVAAVLAFTITALGSISADAATLYVAKTGSDGGNNCATQTTPCQTIAHGIESLAGGDTLIIGDGTYTESITGMPSGSASAYTTIRAANDWGVTIDGSGWADSYKNGINISSAHYVHVRGFHVKMNQATLTNEPVAVPYSDHVKIQRCSGSYAPTSGNPATFDVGPTSSYVLIEECYAFGGGRYQFVVYDSDHVVVRRSVARHDYATNVAVCAGFANYDSASTVWQNDIVLDSDTANCKWNDERLYGGFYSENQPDDSFPDTTQVLEGVIILNVQAVYAGDFDLKVTGQRTIHDMVIWDSSGGYYGDQGPGLAANISATRMTLGGTTGVYNVNGGQAQGTGFTVVGSSVPNMLTNSILSQNNSFGVADYTISDYNAFLGNGANYGGAHQAVPGLHDIAPDADVTPSLRYLPRIEPASPLKVAGQGGGQIGAEIMFMIGAAGTLYGEASWDDVTGIPLWPFPNEDVMKSDMAAYSGPGGQGARGFATGNSLDGSPQTLTKYIWEYLGHPIPADVYGFHIAVDSLPAGMIGVPYSVPVSVGGGTAPFTYALTGSLPPGLALGASTGLIAGTPSTPGLSTFTITVADAGSPPAMTSKDLSIEITMAATTTGTGGAASTSTGTSAISTTTGAGTTGAGAASATGDGASTSTGAGTTGASGASTGSSASVAGAGGGTTGAGGASNVPINHETDDGAGCGCRTSHGSGNAPLGALLSLLAYLVARRRLRNRCGRLPRELQV